MICEAGSTYGLRDILHCQLHRWLAEQPALYVELTYTGLRNILHGQQLYEG